MRRTFNLAEWAICHRSFVTFIMVVILAAGAWSYVRLGRSEDPPFTVKEMIVQAQWPGATISDTLQQVTARIEKKLQETPYLDHLRSYTLPGRATIEVTLKDSVAPRSVPDIWYQVRKKLDDIRSTLPQGVVGPDFNDEFGDTFPIIYGFTADGFTHRELRDYVERVRSRLLLVQNVNKVNVIGAQDERLYLEVSAQQTSVDRFELARVLQAQNAVAPAGVVRTGRESIRMRVTGGFASEDDLRRVNFVSNGQLIRLSDVGTVTRTYADPPQPMFRVRGQPAIALAISMREGGDIVALGRDMKREMASITADLLPVGIEPVLVADQPQVVSHAVDDFMRSLGEALIIVIAVSFVSLGFRAGAVVALSIPVVLAVVFVYMDLSDTALQRVSLAALVMSLGLMVDDAMITVEMMVKKLEDGWARTEAATYAYMTTHFPMGTGTLVTAAAFLPIGMAKSMTGEYLFSLFTVVAVALIASWFVAAIFTPLFGAVLLSENVKHRAHRPPGRVMRGFREILVLALRWRSVTVALAVASFALAIVGLAFVPRQFFPSSDRLELFVDLKLPQYASITATDKAASELDRLLLDDPDVDRWSTYVGQGAVRFYLSMIPQLPNEFFAQAIVVAKNLEARERLRTRIEQALYEKFPEVVGRVYPLQLGPPVEWPVQFRVSGPETSELRKIAYRLAAVMAQSPQLRNLNFDWTETAKTLQIKVDQEQAKLLNLSSASLAQALDMVVSGTTVTQIRDSIYLIDVVLRGPEQERVSLESLGTLQIPLPNGRTVPLMQVASIDYGQELPVIRRRDGVPTLTVQAEVPPDVAPETAAHNLQSKIAAFSATLPAGYKVEVGGVAEKNETSQSALMMQLPLMLILLLTIMMVQLQSFRRLLLALSVAPLGFIGVVIALLVSGKALGFVALVGVIALVGLDVRNSVILMVQTDAEIAQGRAPWDAVVEATVHRFRPILLTASAAALGMIPIASAVLWSAFAYAVIGGITVATIMTLIVLPALYVLWFRIEEPLPQQGGRSDIVAAPSATRAVVTTEA